MKRALLLLLSCCALTISAACSRTVTLQAVPLNPETHETAARAAMTAGAKSAPPDTETLAALLRTAAEPRPCSAGSSLRMAALAGGLLRWAEENRLPSSEAELSSLIRQLGLSAAEMQRACSSLRLLKDAADRMGEAQLRDLLLDAGFETGSSSCDREEFCALLDALLGELEPKIFKLNENGVNISGNNHCRPGKRVL